MSFLQPTFIFSKYIQDLTFFIKLSQSKRLYFDLYYFDYWNGQISDARICHAVNLLAQVGKMKMAGKKTPKNKEIAGQ